MSPFFYKKVGLLKNLISSQKTLFENFSYLALLQIINLVIPVLIFPYLIRVLGKETYGLIVFAQSIVGYFLILVSFGFNITSTQKVSISRDNKNKLGEIVCSVFILKTIFFVASFILLFLLLKINTFSNLNKTLFYLTMTICLADVIFPTWYFQGIEKMKYITFITLASRITSTILIFILIK